MGNPDAAGGGGGRGGDEPEAQGEDVFEESTEALDKPPPEDLSESVGRFGTVPSVQPLPAQPATKRRSERSPTIEEILAIDGNRDSFDRLREALRNTSVVPFVGAGLSVPLDYPGWSNFLLKLAAEHGVEQPVRERLDADDYEGAAEAIIAKVGRTGFDFAIDANFGPAQMSPVLRGAVVQLPKLFQGPVITTNFDQVIERTYDEAGRPFEDVFIGFDAERAILKDMRNERYLLKIHGDVDLKKGRILTRESYEEHYGPGDTVDRTKDLPQTISRIAASHQLVFLGCSLAQDRTMHVLRDLAPQTSHVPHFAIIEEPEDPEAKVAKFKLLAEHNIRAIWYPHDRHECVERILAELSEEVGIPTRGRLLVPGIYLALLVALVISILNVFGASNEPYGRTIRMGIVSPTDVRDSVVRSAFDRQFEKFNHLQSAAGDKPAYEIAQQTRYNRDRIDEAIRDLRDKKIDALGVLSPYWVYRAVEEADVEPVVSPRYGGSSTYEAVVFVNTEWLRTRPDLTPAERRELPRATDDAGKLDTRIRPALWKRLMSALRERRGVIAVMDDTSTSGYWYPRKLVISELRAEVGFDQVTTSPPGDEYEIIRKVAQGSEKVIAGAIATFRLETAPSGRADEFKEHRAKITVVHRMSTIPNGAFVIREELARDRTLVKALRESWGEASRQTYETATVVDGLADPVKTRLEAIREAPTSEPAAQAAALTTAYQDLVARLEAIDRVRAGSADAAAIEAARSALRGEQEAEGHGDRPMDDVTFQCRLRAALELKNGLATFTELTALAEELRSDVGVEARDVELVIAGFPSVLAPIKRCYPREWSPVDSAHYLPAFDAFRIRDPAEAPKAAMFTTFLMIGAGLLLVIAFAFLIQRHRRVAPKESSE